MYFSTGVASVLSPVLAIVFVKKYSLSMLFYCFGGMNLFGIASLIFFNED